MRRVSNALGPIVAVGTALAAALVLVAAFQLARTIVTVSSDPWRDADLRDLSGAPTTGIAGMLSRGERVTLLLLGYGGVGHDGAYLTDSLMVASLEPQRNTVTLLSIPRDLYVRLPATKYTVRYQAKANEAFAIGAMNGDRDEGIRAAAAVLEEVLGISIDRRVAIDFQAFRRVVDAIAGIDLVVDRAFIAMYPRNDDPDIDASWMEISFKAGPQHLDGETALRYTRARYIEGEEGTDFARSVRQQKVILAAKDKVIATKAVPSLFGLLDALRDNVRTDLSIADMRALADFARGYEDAKTVRAALTPHNVIQEGMLENAGYTLFPKVQGWREVHAYVRRAFEFSDALSEDAEVVVEASLVRSGAAAAAARRLADLGFRARAQVNAVEDGPRTTILDALGPQRSASARFLSDYFASPLVAPAGGGVIVVRLGLDWSPPAELAAPHEKFKPLEDP